MDADDLLLTELLKSRVEVEKLTDRALVELANRPLAREQRFQVWGAYYVIGLVGITLSTRNGFGWSWIGCATVGLVAIWIDLYRRFKLRVNDHRIGEERTERLLRILARDVARARGLELKCDRRSASGR
jgi:hypothetical protein